MGKNLYGIFKDNITSFAYTNEREIYDKNAIIGMVLDFHGLNMAQFYPPDPTSNGIYFGERNILYVIPYDDPWSWMNDVAVTETEKIIDALIDKFSLSKDIPIVSMGGSMGGHNSLVFTQYSTHNIVACGASCPPCDMFYQYGSKDDIPRTMYAAFAHYDCPLEEAIKSASPIHMIDRFKKIPYYFLHGDADTRVSITPNSVTLVNMLLERGYDVKYEFVKGGGHGNGRTPFDAYLRYLEFAVGNLVKEEK